MCKKKCFVNADYERPSCLVFEAVSPAPLCGSINTPTIEEEPGGFIWEQS